MRRSILICLAFVILALAKEPSSIKKDSTPSSSKSAVSHHKGVQTLLTPDEALARLVAGNQRFISATVGHPDQTAERRSQQAKGQTPFAVIVGCSDSRVPPEIIFDQGIGSLFVFRSAGHVVDSVAVGSIEYAVQHLGVPLILVLGHERCGAVTATVNEGQHSGSIGHICGLIKPAVERAKSIHKGGDLVDQAVRANVGLVAERIAQSSLVRKAMQEGRLKIVRAYYDIDDGTVKPVP